MPRPHPRFLGLSKPKKKVKWKIGDVFVHQMVQIDFYGVVIGKRTALMVTDSTTPHTNPIPSNARLISSMAIGIPSEVRSRAEIIRIAFRAGARWGSRRARAGS